MPDTPHPAGGRPSRSEPLCMKRIATIVVALVIAAGALPAVATPVSAPDVIPPSAPGASVGVDQFAEADWIVMQGRDRAKMYFALAWRTVSEWAGAMTLGVVGKGKCFVERSKHMTMIGCNAYGRAKELGMDEYEFDPLLRSAAIDYHFKGQRQRVSWRGRGRTPHAGADVGGGDGYVQAGAGMAREARATARIFGREMTTGGGWLSFSYLGQGAGAGVHTDYGRTLKVAADGSFTYRVEVRLPR